MSSRVLWHRFEGFLSVAVNRDFSLLALFSHMALYFLFSFCELAAPHPTSLAVTIPRFSRVQLWSAREAAFPSPLLRLAVGSLFLKAFWRRKRESHICIFFVLPSLSVDCRHLPHGPSSHIGVIAVLCVEVRRRQCVFFCLIIRDQ
jgi:hypothetical protein